jgi:ligand-binding SRPBCC domain-containing protein
MLKYRHQYKIRIPCEVVARFHMQPSGLSAITPPPVFVRLHRVFTDFHEGAEMDFTLWFGLFPVRWNARFEEVTPNSFIDRQLRGPFRHWVHRHSFLPLDENQTLVSDEIIFEIRKHPFWGPVGALMWANLPVLFAYRAWKTRRLLETR